MTEEIILIVIRCNGRIETTTYKGYLAESSSDRDFNEIVNDQHTNRLVDYAVTIYPEGGFRQRYVRPYECQSKT